MAQDDAAVSEVILTIVTRIAELTRQRALSSYRRGDRGVEAWTWCLRTGSSSHSRTLSDSQLFDLTVSAIDDCYRRAWTKLHSRHKADRLASFADAQKEPLD